MKRKKRILLALKFIESPEHLLEKIQSMQIDPDASLYLVHVIHDMPRMSFYSDAYRLWEEFRNTVVVESLKRMNSYIKKFSVRFTDIESLVDVGDPAEVIVRIADKLKADMLIIGNNPQKPKQHFIHHDTGTRIVQLSKKPVLSLYLGR